MQVFKAGKARLRQWVGQHALALAAGGSSFAQSAGGVVLLSLGNVPNSGGPACLPR